MFAKRIIWTVIALNVIFTASVLYVFLRTSSEPSTLVAAWFAFTTGELWHLANIKKHKIKGGVKSEGFETVTSVDADQGTGVDNTMQG